MVDLHHLVTDLLIPGIGPDDKIIRTFVVYLFTTLLLRVAGKRLMAQMNSLDLVVVLERLGLTTGELRSALRRQGADDITEVEHADIEPGGDIVVNLRREEQNVSYGELRAAVDELKAYIDQMHEQMHREAPGSGGAPGSGEARP